MRKVGALQCCKATMPCFFGAMEKEKGCSRLRCVPMNGSRSVPQTTISLFRSPNSFFLRLKLAPCRTDKKLTIYKEFWLARLSARLLQGWKPCSYFGGQFSFNAT